MVFVFSDKDKGFAALFKKLKAGKATLTVGIHGAEGGTPDGSGKLTVGDVATIHEYGLGNCPERSFIRSWADENQAKNRITIEKVMGAVVSGRLSVKQSLDAIGLRFVAEMQARIVAGIEPPLAESTIARKGSSTPLIDTGQLKSSIRHKVEGVE